MPESFNTGADQNANNQGSDQGSFSEQGVIQDQDNNLAASGNQLSQEDISALLKKSEHAEQHIKTLEQENGKLREDFSVFQKKLDSIGDLDEALNRDNIDEDSLIDKARERILSELKAEKAQDVYDSNYTNVSENLTARYGDKVDEVVSKVAKDNGMTLAEVVELSKTKPQLVLNMCDVKIEGSIRPTQSSINSAAFQVTPDPVAKTGMDLYEELQSSDAARIAHMQKTMDEYNT